MRVNSVLVAALALYASAFAQSSATLSFSAAPLWPLSGDVSRFSVDQYVFTSPAVSEYVVALRSADGAVERTLRAPIHNKVAPEVTASVSRDSDGKFHYLYSVSNGVSAAMPIERWALAIEEVGHQLVLSHPSWKGGQSAAKLPGISREQHEVYQWESAENGALSPGKTASEFEIVSDLAPGYVLGVFYGKASTPELTAEDWASLPEPAAAQLRNALSTRWDSQSRQVVGPRFPPGAELDVVEANFYFGLREMQTSGRIARDSTVGNELGSALNDSLQQAEITVPPVLDSLKPAAGSKEAELLSAFRLTLSSLRTK
jgi:hypothetical protein